MLRCATPYTSNKVVDFSTKEVSYPTSQTYNLIHDTKDGRRNGTYTGVYRRWLKYRPCDSSMCHGISYLVFRKKRSSQRVEERKKPQILACGWNGLAMWVMHSTRYTDATQRLHLRWSPTAKPVYGCYRRIFFLPQKFQNKPIKKTPRYPWRSKHLRSYEDMMLE